MESETIQKYITRWIHKYKRFKPQNQIDPITQEPVHQIPWTHKWYHVIGPNMITVYNVSVLYDYLYTSLQFKCPLTRTPFQKVEVMRIQSLYNTLAVKDNSRKSLIDQYDLVQQHGPGWLPMDQEREMLMVWMERNAGEAISKMINLCEYNFFTQETYCFKKTQESCTLLPEHAIGLYHFKLVYIPTFFTNLSEICKLSNRYASLFITQTKTMVQNTMLKMQDAENMYFHPILTNVLYKVLTYGEKMVRLYALRTRIGATNPIGIPSLSFSVGNPILTGFFGTDGQETTLFDILFDSCPESFSELLQESLETRTVNSNRTTRFVDFLGRSNENPNGNPDSNPDSML